MRFTVNFLLLSLASLVISSSQVRAATVCDDAFTDISTALLTGDDCTSVDGTCPTTCKDLISATQIACKGGATTDEETGEEEPYSPAELLGIGLLMDEGCADTATEVVLSTPGVTCDDWLVIDSFSAIFLCSVECTDNCKEIIDAVHAACSATSTRTDDLGKTMTAQQAQDGLTMFRNSDCNDYADTVSFTGAGSSSSAQVISSSRIIGAALFGLAFSLSF
jgi:hypothetical protein